MDRNLSRLVQEALEKLEMDAESRRLAMKDLKSYATNIDTRAIPQFIAQISETNNQGSPSRECRISLFEVLARVHGRNIVPQIDIIMKSIIGTLSTKPLHYACSRVVLAIARYGIDPSTTDDEKKKIILSLTTPLSNALMSSHESLASGSALCLKVLVESNNWKFASDDTINDVCLKVAGALEEKTTQTNSHMCLAMALAKHNSSIAEAYVGSLIRSGLHLLSVETTENNSHKRFPAIQMVNFLMKCIDSRSFSSELAEISDAMEKCKADHIEYVKGAASEALQTAKAVALQKGSKCEPTDDSDSLNSDITTDAEEIRQSIESVSSTADPAEDKGSEMIGIPADAELKVTQINGRKMVWYRKYILVFVLCLAMIFLAIIMSIQRDDDDKFSYGLVPT